MLIDEVTIRVRAGHGGKGAVAFNKQAMSLGPAGGSGGLGGSVYFEGVSDLSALKQFRYKKDLTAENGENGKAQFNDGTDGRDLTLKIPVGTVIKKIVSSDSSLSMTEEVFEIVKVGEKIVVAQGGNGGKGNFLFRSSRNTTPTQFQKGLPGEECIVKLELKLIADVGLIGLPNAGKSSLINELTKTKSKVANYPFTTLEPHLGVYHDIILADIPGLIEGASGGKGLGTKFLRHIERTKILFHLVSADSENPIKDYKTIQKELKTYNVELPKKTEYIFLSKSDTISETDLKKKIALFKKAKKVAIPISVYDWDSLKKVEKILNKIGKDK